MILCIRNSKITGRNLVKLLGQDPVVQFKPNAYTMLLSLNIEICKAFR